MRSTGAGSHGSARTATIEGAKRALRTRTALSRYSGQRIIEYKEGAADVGGSLRPHTLCVRLYARVRVRVRVCVRVCASARARVVCVCACVCVCMRVYACVCVCVCMRLRVCVYSSACVGAGSMCVRLLTCVV